jgi:hypothetical protein
MPLQTAQGAHCVPGRRSSQLPPEAWLRFGGFNGSMTILSIRPVSGRVGAISFGDFGHMSLDETTFGFHTGLE